MTTQLPLARAALARTAAAGLAVLMLVFVPGPAAAAEWSAELGLQKTTLVTQAAHAVTRDRGVQGTSVRAWRSIAPLGKASADETTAFSVELGYHEFAESARLYDDANTDLAAQVVLAGASFRSRLFPMVEPVARLAVGAAWLDLALTETRSYHAAAVRPVAQAGVGIDVLIPRHIFQKSDGTSRHEFTLGLAFEAGWTHIFSWQAVLDPAFVIAEGVRARPIDLGTLKLSGMHGRIAVVVRL